MGETKIKVGYPLNYTSNTISAEGAKHYSPGIERIE